VFGRFSVQASALVGLIVRQYQTPVREQPDTGYRKSLLSYFATTLGGGMLLGL